MDTRRFIVAMILSMAVYYGYLYFTSRNQPPQPAATATQAAATAPATTTQPTSAPAPTQVAELAPQGPRWQARAEKAQGTQVVPLGLDTPEGAFKVQAILTNRGAAVEKVQMVAREKNGDDVKYKYAATVKGTEPYVVLEPVTLPNGQVLNSWATAAVRLGQPEVTVPLDVPWDVETFATPEGAQVARFSVMVMQGDQPVVRVVKTYTLAPNSYGIDMDLAFELQDGQETRLVVDQLGPVGINRIDHRADYRKVYVVTRQGDRLSPEGWQHSHLAKSTGPVTIGSAYPIEWIALVDKYFAAITAPENPAAGIAGAQLLTNIKDPAATNGDLSVAMTLPPMQAAPGKPARLAYDLYVGPKDIDIFTANPQYAARQYSLLRSAEYAWCTFSALGELMTSILHWLYGWIPNYGIAIIILVLIVRVILHPLTKHQQVAMTRMQQKQAEVAPKIEAAKQRFANDRQQLQLEMMRIYREAGINPASQVAGCLPMVIQLPIWVALYSALQYDINLWHAPFMLWIRDLSAPDALYNFAGPVNLPLLSWIMGPIYAINVLPVLLAISMYLQQKFTPKPKPAPGTSPEMIAQQQQMQKMMGFMMIFMGLIFYNMPSGLNLYIMASSFFGILEQKRIRKHIEEQKNRPVEPAKPRKRNPWINGMLEKLEKRARDSRTVKKGKE